MNRFIPSLMMSLMVGLPAGAQSRTQGPPLPESLQRIDIDNYTRNIEQKKISFDIGGHTYTYNEVGMPEIVLQHNGRPRSPVAVDYFASVNLVDRTQIEKWLSGFNRIWISDLALGAPDRQGHIPFIIQVPWQPNILLKTQATLRIIGTIELSASQRQAKGKAWDDSSVTDRDENKSASYQRLFERNYRIRLSGVAFDDSNNQELPISNVAGFIKHVLNPILTRQLSQMNLR